MSDKVAEAAIVLAPIGTGARKGQRVNGTGSTEQHNTTPLAQGAYATIISDTALFASWASASALSNQVATGTAFLIPANTYFSWVVEKGSRHIYVEAKDGASAWDAYVWQSGQGLG